MGDTLLTLHGHRLFHVILNSLSYPDWHDAGGFSVSHLPIKASPHYVIFDDSHVVVIYVLYVNSRCSRL